jgi:DNA-binding NtrC family response regulator
MLPSGGHDGPIDVLTNDEKHVVGEGPTGMPATGCDTMHDARLHLFPFRDPPPLILLVESDVGVRLCVANELLDQGYEVVEGDNAGEAMSILGGRNDFDAMIADVHVDQAPGGLALVRYIARNRPGVGILITSEGNEAQPESLTIGARFLAKPFLGGALVREMRLLLAR